MDSDKLVDYIFNKINEEAKDVGEYHKMADMAPNTHVRKILDNIASDEMRHHDWLVKLLAMMAKNSYEEEGKDAAVQ